MLCAWWLVFVGGVSYLAARPCQPTTIPLDGQLHRMLSQTKQSVTLPQLMSNSSGHGHIVSVCDSMGCCSVYRRAVISGVWRGMPSVLLESGVAPD
jgi:hypothetical protein